MTLRMQASALDEIRELLAEHGFDGMARALTVLLNEVMKLERAAVLGAGPCERAERRAGHANGFKPRIVQARVGALTLAVPQARGSRSTPRPWRGACGASGRRSWPWPRCTSRVALAARWRPSPSSFYGLEVTSSQVSRAAGALDVELEGCRTRLLGETP